MNAADLLKRLYAAGAKGPWAETQLAADALTYISALEHALQGDRRPMGFERLLLILGESHGALSTPDFHDMLVASLRDGALKPTYITALRDQLSEILCEAGRDTTSRRPSMEACNEVVR